MVESHKRQFARETMICGWKRNNIYIIHTAQQRYVLWEANIVRTRVLALHLLISFQKFITFNFYLYLYFISKNQKAKQ